MRLPFSASRSTARFVAVVVAVTLAVTSLLTLEGGWAYAAGPGAGGTAYFKAGAVNPPGGLSYFNYTASSGQTIHGQILVVNTSKTTETLGITPAQGLTAPNSGAVYASLAPGAKCQQSECWLDIPRTSVTLAAGQSQNVPFSVSVPAGTPDGQYLAGVSTGLAVSQAPNTTTPTTADNKAGATATVRDLVIIGVAVSVGSGWPDTLSIPTVTGGYIGTTPAAIVTETDTGRAFQHPKGFVTVGQGKNALTVKDSSLTILPGGTAQLRVPFPHLHPGIYPSKACLTYDKTTKTACWAGKITLAGAPKQPLSVGPHTRVVTVTKGIPGWVWLIVVGGGVAFLLAVIIGIWLLLAAKKRRDDDDDESENPPPAHLVRASR